MIGLISGKKMNDIYDMQQKKSFLMKRHITACLSAISLCICANPTFGMFISNKYCLALIMALASGTMASSVSFQFYQLPTVFSNHCYAEARAVCTSLFDAFAYFLSSQAWSILGKMSSNSQLHPHGWSILWLMVASFHMVGGYITIRSLPKIYGSMKESWESIQTVFQCFVFTQREAWYLSGYSHEHISWIVHVYRYTILKEAIIENCKFMT